MSSLRQRSPKNSPVDGPLKRIDGVQSGETSRSNIRQISTPIKILLICGSFLLAIVTWTKSIGSINADSQTLKPYALCSKGDNAVYTVDRDNSVTQCLLILNARISDTGTLDEISTRWRSHHPQVSLSGFQFLQLLQSPKLEVKYIPDNAIVVPGLSDSHGHILEYGASRLLPLEGTKTIAESVTRVRNFVLSHPDIFNDTSRLVEGWGWDHTAWPEKDFPSYRDLEVDPVLRGRQISLQSKDGHAQWVSEATLKLMTPLPEHVEGGLIVRDKSGNPTGVLLDKAQDLIKRPVLTDTDLLQRFKLTVNDAYSKGITSLHDAGFDPASLEFYKRQTEYGNLPIRIYGMTYFDEDAEYWGDRRSKIINHNRLTARSVKIFADGALRSGHAALFEPYTDNPGSSGYMRIDREKLLSFVPKFLEDGWQVNIHAIGDRANSEVLDVFEASLQNYLNGANISEIRPRLEHAQIILPKDVQRMAKLGVIASVQPTHAVSDMWYAEDRLGPERIKNLYAFRTMIDAGARITLGTDFPVEALNPMATFHAAVTRLSPDGRSPRGSDGWFPEQRLTRVEALRGMTIDPAYASFSEKDLGSLEPGKLADFAILSQNIMTVDQDKLLDTEVLATVIEGEIVYGKI